MDAELKAKWVEALRGRKYKQGQRALLNRGSYCCLGVLCDLMGCQWLEGDGDQGATINGEKQDYYLPDIALQAAGLSESQQERLYMMNDEGSSFKEIAAHIELNL